MERRGGEGVGEREGSFSETQKERERERTILEARSSVHTAEQETSSAVGLSVTERFAASLGRP